MSEFSIDVQKQVKLHGYTVPLLKAATVDDLWFHNQWRKEHTTEHKQELLKLKEMALAFIKAVVPDRNDVKVFLLLKYPEYPENNVLHDAYAFHLSFDDRYKALFSTDRKETPVPYIHVYPNSNGYRDELFYSDSVGQSVVSFCVEGTPMPRISLSFESWNDLMNGTEFIAKFAACETADILEALAIEINDDGY